MPAPIIDARFHFAMHEPSLNEARLGAFWEMLPATPLASMTVRFGDGETEVTLPFGTDPLLTGGFYHFYALEDGILDTYALRLTAALEGGGSVAQHMRFTVDAANAADRALNGTGLADAILGGSGNDTFSGLGGHDLLHGGLGNDLLFGGLGDDWMDGGAGDDVLHGGDGENMLFGGDGADSLLGGAGFDFIVGDGFDGGWDDTLTGRGGNDDLFGYGGNDLIFGGFGHDYLDGGDGNDTMIGGEGNDGFFGGAGNDFARGDAGNDYFDAGDGDGDDTLVGGAGEDTFRGWGGDDLLRLGLLDGARDVVILNLEVSHGVDRVFDFEVGIDVLMIQGIAAIPEARFVASASPPAPLGSDPALLYNTVTGRLFLDLDGRGGNPAELLAIFRDLPSLSYADLVFA